MEIKLVTSDKKEFLDLLLLADEQESMIDRYLERGDMFVLYDDGLKALCVVTREGEGVYEIKNIAAVPSRYGQVVPGFAVHRRHLQRRRPECLHLVC